MPAGKQHSSLLRWSLQAGGMTVRSEVGEKQDTHTERVTLGSETRVRTQIAKLSFHPGIDFLGTYSLAPSLSLGPPAVISWGWSGREWGAPVSFWDGVREQDRLGMCSRDRGHWNQVTHEYKVMPRIFFIILDLCGSNQLCASQSSHIILSLFIGQIFILCQK